MTYQFDGSENGYARYEDDWNHGPNYGSGYNSNYVKNEMYYHHRVYVKIIRKTEKAYLVASDEGKYWIPKALLLFVRYRGWGGEDKNEGEFWQYDKFEVNYLDE